MKALLIASSIAIAGNALADEALRREAAGLFGQLTAPAGAPSAQAELGRALFWDTRVSADGKTACSSCHFARDWSADRRPFSTDARGELTSRHSPPVFNTMSLPGLRWLADRKTGAIQAEGSLTGSLGFASREAALSRLSELGYSAKFRAAFPDDGLSAANYGHVLEAYQATLVTPASFDRFLAGDDAALNERQKAGPAPLRVDRLRGLPQGRAIRRNDAAEVWGGQGLLARDEIRQAGRAPLRRDPEGGRPLRLPRAAAAQRGEDRALLPRRLGGRARSRGTGEIPASYAPPL